MNGPIAETANFTVNPGNFAITVSALPVSGGTVGGGGAFGAGSSRTVMATANAGFNFTNWTESGSPVSTSPSYSFNLNGNRSLVANFVTTASQPPKHLTGMGISNGMIRFVLNGLVGSNYVIQISSNLVTWSRLGMYTIPTGGSLLITDYTNGFLKRFFRAEPTTVSIMENFTNAPNYTNAWQVVGNTGGIVTTCTNGNLRVQASTNNPGSAFTMLSKESLTGDVDYSVQLNHQGFGRTFVGLWSVASNNWLALSVLDTDDTAYLAFSAGTLSTEYKYASEPYLNRWVNLQIKTVGNTVQFFVNGVLFEATTVAMPAAFRFGFSVGSVPWKSGDNDTSIRSLTVSGSKP